MNSAHKSITIRNGLQRLLGRLGLRREAKAPETSCRSCESIRARVVSILADSGRHDLIKRFGTIDDFRAQHGLKPTSYNVLFLDQLRRQELLDLCARIELARQEGSR